jgi:hypothetical protein
MALHQGWNRPVEAVSAGFEFRWGRHIIALLLPVRQPAFQAGLEGIITPTVLQYPRSAGALYRGGCKGPITPYRGPKRRGLCSIRLQVRPRPSQGRQMGSIPIWNSNFGGRARNPENPCKILACWVRFPSSPPVSTPHWWNGRHSTLRTCRRKASGFKSWMGYQIRDGRSCHVPPVYLLGSPGQVWRNIPARCPRRVIRGTIFNCGLAEID